jgi:hypothetical protein
MKESRYLCKGWDTSTKKESQRKLLILYAGAGDLLSFLCHDTEGNLCYTEVENIACCVNECRDQWRDSLISAHLP